MGALLLALPIDYNEYMSGGEHLPGRGTAALTIDFSVDREAPHHSSFAYRSNLLPVRLVGHPELVTSGESPPSEWPGV
jgi:hypothetical protein